MQGFDQLRRVERLHDPAGRSGGAGAGAEFWSRFRREDKDRDRAEAILLTYCFDEAEPVEPGHVYVGNDSIRRDVAQPFQPGDPIFCG